MWLARLLDQGVNCRCVHEYSTPYALLKPAWQSGDLSAVREAGTTAILPAVREANAAGKKWGEVSGLLYFLFPELERIFGVSAKYVLLVRRPVTFVRSALARGFFCPNHPHALEHAAPPFSSVGKTFFERPAAGSEAAKRWAKWGPVEKNLWYWAAVNSYILNFFDELQNNERCMVLRLEDFSVQTMLTLLDFLCVKGLNVAQVKIMLEKPINRTPTTLDDMVSAGSNDGRFNPFSLSLQEAALPFRDWPETWQEAYKSLALPLELRLYTEDV